MTSNTKLLPFITLMFALTACGGDFASSPDADEADNSGEVGDETDSSGEAGDETDDTQNNLISYTILDASDNEQAYLDLDSGHNVTDNDPWHLAYKKYVGFSNPALNSGIQTCIAKEYTTLYDEDGEPVTAEFDSLTMANTLDDFNAVTPESCTDFSGGEPQSQFQGWYTYNSTIHTTPPNDDDSNGWIIRSSSTDESGTYAYTRLIATDYNSLSGKVTFSSELWDSNSQAFKAAESTGALGKFNAAGSFNDNIVLWNMEDNSNATASISEDGEFFDFIFSPLTTLLAFIPNPFEDGIKVNDIADWDVKIITEGHDKTILVNGGVSGTGNAGVGVGDVKARVVTDPTDPDQIYTYLGDSAAWAMANPGDYGALEYDVDGKHEMWPTFAIYLFKDDERYFKVQVLGNYGADDSKQSGTLYIRHQEIFK